MSENKKKTFVIFQTVIDGRLAQCEIETDPLALQSRETRKDAEIVARLAFAKLSPSWVSTQRVKAVDIVTVEVEPAGDDAAIDWADVAFTCDYCGHAWTERYPNATINRKTLRGCRLCLIKYVPGNQVRYAGADRGSGADAADLVLSRGNVYTVAQAFKSDAGVNVELAGIRGRFDFLLFEPVELAN